MDLEAFMTFLGFKWEDRYEQFDGLGETQLLHLARNEAAPVENRLFAAELMLKRGYQSVKHVDLSGLVAQLDHLKIDPITPNSTQEAPNFGAPSASVTTISLSEEPVIVQKTDKKSKKSPAPEAPTPEPQPELKD